MRIFLTGATGFIGSHILPLLLAAGHEVIGTTRSDTGARRLESAGALAHFGTLEDPVALAAGAENADAVIHTAFDHDFSNFLANCEKDRQVIGALGSVLKGSDRPLLITSGVGIGDPGNGEPAREDVFDADHFNPRIASELAGQAQLDAGVNLGVVRLPQVHDTVRQGLISPFVAMSRQNGRVAVVDGGHHRWAACHVTDVARLYVLALERAEPGVRYHAVSEEGVKASDIAEVIAQGLALPLVSISAAEAQDVLGWFAMFATSDIIASSAQTQAELDWHPQGPGLLDDLRKMDYAAL